MSEQILKHSREFRNALANEEFEATNSGLLLYKQEVQISGTYYHSVNGQDLQVDHNLIPTAAILDILDVYFGAGTKKNSWFIALYSGQINPTASWTAANFATTSSEVTSPTEGYSNTTRPTFTPSPAAAGQITNIANKSVFNIVCSTKLTVEGLALLSNNAKGGTQGTLASATRLQNARELFNGDQYEVGYGVQLTL